MSDEVPIVEAAKRRRPPDATDAQWRVALAGLRTFLAGGYGDEAERLGWSKDELYAAPPLWVRGDLCGVGLAIGDRKVVGVTADRIAIRTASGAELAFYRKPKVDYRLVFEAHLKLAHGNYPADREEPRLRAIEAASALYRQNNGCNVDVARDAVLVAIGAAP